MNAWDGLKRKNSNNTNEGRDRGRRSARKQKGKRAMIWTALGLLVISMYVTFSAVVFNSTVGVREGEANEDGGDDGKNSAFHFPTYESVFMEDEGQAMTMIDREVLRRERRRIYEQEKAVAKQDAMKIRRTNGKYKRLEKARTFTKEEIKGYVEHCESEEARARNALRSVPKCDSVDMCEKICEETVAKTIEGLLQSDRLFVDREIIGSINLSNRAFGSQNAEKAILALSDDGDHKKMEILGFVENNHNEKFRGRAKQNINKKKKKRECAVVGNGPIKEDLENADLEDDDSEENESVGKNKNKINSGDMIDANDVIFRVNNAPFGGSKYAEKVGRRSDFRVLNNAWAAKYSEDSPAGRKYRDAIVDETIISTRASADRFFELASRFHEDSARRVSNKISSLKAPWMTSDRVQSDVRKLLEKIRALKTRIAVMRDEKNLNETTNTVKRGGTSPSTGLLAIFLALSSGCDKVQTFGFSLGKPISKNMKKYHYFNDAEAFHNPTHDYFIEGELIRILKQLGY